MKIIEFFSLSLVVLFLSSCASNKAIRGSVVMKMSPDLAHVYLGNNEVQVGDRVTAFKHNCSRASGDKLPDLKKEECAREKLGNGTVVKILNDRYSEVKFDSGVVFEEGTSVEKE